MITSEVQRTLVKSPPELWSELSDPQALARLLGELGEVEIVRTVPEQLVEWKTANATGTVRIKPSGWGTKVTLSVSKELPEAAPEDAKAVDPNGAEASSPDAGADEAGAAAISPGAETESADAGRNSPSAEAESADAEDNSLDAEADQAVTTATTDGATVEPIEASATTEQAADANPAAVTGEPIAAATPEADPTAVVAEPQADSADGLDAKQPEETSMAAEAVDAPLDGPDEPTTEAALTREKPPAVSEVDSLPSQGAPAPRRGFFARLFGRRQKGEAPASPTQPVSEHDLEPMPTEVASDPGPTIAVAEPPSEPAAIEPSTAVGLGESPPESTASSEPVAAGMEPAAPVKSTPDSTAEPDAPVEPQAVTAMEPASPIEPQADTATEQAPPEPAVVEATIEEGTEAEGDQEAPTPLDMAAELKAAEEVAEEEVRAVLTAVLDRLGAAHHRPFSRA